MLTFQKKIVEDFKDLVKKEGLADYLPKNDIERIAIIFENELIKKYNSIYNFINSTHNDGKETASYVINMNDYKIMLTIYMCGSYRIKFIHRKTVTGKFDKMFLINEFKREVGYVYFIKSIHGYKIGKTKNIKNRLKIFEVKLPFDFELKYYVRTIDYNELERTLHEYFVEKQINGEWFSLTTEDIDKLRIYLKTIGYKLSDNNNLLNVKP